MSTRLFLVRHGESIWNAEGRLQGQADAPLSMRGVQQAGALARALSTRPLAAIYTSPLRRAQATATAIGHFQGLEPLVVDALREMHLGCWQGHITADLGQDDLDGIWARDQGITALAPPDGETLGDAATRVGPAIDNILASHRYGSVVVVAHSIIGRIMLCHLLDTSLDLVSRLKLKQASITLLRLDEAGVVLERLGDTCHLYAVSGASE
jgi:broad specificity phosphatase PhoE